MSENLDAVFAALHELKSLHFDHSVFLTNEARYHVQGFSSRLASAVPLSSSLELASRADADLQRAILKAPSAQQSTRVQVTDAIQTVKNVIERLKEKIVASSAAAKAAAETSMAAESHSATARQERVQTAAAQEARRRGALFQEFSDVTGISPGAKAAAEKKTDTTSNS